ncbi:MAG TPA: hypothetical protein VNA12_06470 [Mycobacteriales bacterium]|nr:hypothetical protein [Mycobacteriales bacterium]
MSAAPLVVAHAGGIPEALSVVVPLGVLIAIIVAGKRRRPPDDPDSTDDSDLSS